MLQIRLSLTSRMVVALAHILLLELILLGLVLLIINIMSQKW